MTVNNPDSNCSFKVQTNRDIEQQKKKEEFIKKAYEEGHQKGYTEGLKEAKNEMTETVKNIDAIVANLQHSLVEYHNLIEQRLVKIIRKVTEACILKEISTSESLILDILNKITDKIPRNSQEVTLLLHPEDTSIIEKYDLTPYFGQKAHIELRADDEVHQGGCQIFADFASIDASLELRMEEFVRIFDEVDSSNASGPTE